MRPLYRPCYLALFAAVKCDGVQTTQKIHTTATRLHATTARSILIATTIKLDTQMVLIQGALKRRKYGINGQGNGFVELLPSVAALKNQSSCSQLELFVM
jgi:hypothetical protein